MLVCWVDPDQQLSTKSVAGLLPTQWDGEENWKSKSKKLVFYSLLPTGGQMFSRAQESRASLHLIVTWEDMYHNLKFLAPPAFSSAIIAEHNIMWYGVSLW